MDLYSFYSSGDFSPKDNVPLQVIISILVPYNLPTYRVAYVGKWIHYIPIRFVIILRLVSFTEKIYNKFKKIKKNEECSNMKKIPHSNSDTRKFWGRRKLMFLFFLPASSAFIQEGGGGYWKWFRFDCLWLSLCGNFTPIYAVGVLCFVVRVAMILLTNRHPPYVICMYVTSSQKKNNISMTFFNKP